jgi:hypothetical protein
MPTLQRQRDNPEDMFTPEQNLTRNKVWAKPGNYNTPLDPPTEKEFRNWVKQGNVPFDPEAKTTDYDMRGFYKAMKSGDPRAKAMVNPNDKRPHYPDHWKTPYAATFSNQSQWALPHAPIWQGDRYMLPNGHVIYDDAEGRWFGLPPGR